MQPPGALLNIVQTLVFAVASAVVFGVKIPRKALWAVAAISFAVFGWIVWTMPWNYHDPEDFWRAGRAALTGKFPYNDPCAMYPPPGVGVFALFAWLPPQIFFALWRLLAAASFAAAAFAAQASLGRAFLPRAELTLLASAVALSVSVRHALGSMSSTFLTLMFLIGAVACRNKEKPLLAGALLALGCPKITTMIPFLALFFRKRDVKTWISLAVVGLFLTFLAVRPSELLPGLQGNLANIRAIGEVGKENDFSFANDTNSDLISFDYAIYHLGVRNRSIVKLSSLLVVGVLGIWVLWQVWRKSSLPHASATSIIACYSGLFLYHRLYDMTILVLPLVYAAGKGLEEQGRVRWVYRSCAFAILWILFLRVSRIQAFIPYAQQPGFLHRVVEALILPHGVWALLGVLIALTVVERRKGPEPVQAIPA